MLWKELDKIHKVCIENTDENGPLMKCRKLMTGVKTDRESLAWDENENCEKKYDSGIIYFIKKS